MNVYEKLMQVQTQLKAPKGQFNTFGNYKYRSCEDILEGLKPLLAEVKATLTLTDKILQIGERFYIEATAIFTDTELGAKVEVSGLARENATQKGMNDAQITGSVSSYARKYSLNGLFCIDDTKDADTLDNSTTDKPIKPIETPKGKKDIETPTDKKGSPLITEGQRKRLFALSKANVELIKEVLAKHKYSEAKEVTVSDYKIICDEIEKGAK